MRKKGAATAEKEEIERDERGNAGMLFPFLRKRGPRLSRIFQSRTGQYAGRPVAAGQHGREWKAARA